MLLPGFTGLALLYAGSTGKGWEPFAFWLGTVSMIMSMEARREAEQARLRVEALMKMQ